VQAPLVSGTNIKTINGGSVLGSGDLAVGGGSMILLSTVTASNSATVDLETGVGSTYDEYVVIGQNISPSANGTPMWRVKVSGAYATSGYSQTNIRGFSGVVASETSNQPGVIFSLASTNANQATIVNFLRCNTNTQYIASGGTPASSMGQAVGFLSNANPAQGFRFMFDSGNITTGTFRLYGIKKS
jgi:hypothetical protein